MTVPADTEAAIDGLYRGPLESFVRERNALAATLRAGGFGDDAKRIKALGKPSISAWAVNAVFWESRRTYDRLVAAGAGLQAIQQEALGSGGSSEGIQQAGRARREALDAAVEAAASLLSTAGLGASATILRRVERTFEAIAAGAGETTRGRLTGDLEPPGFEALLTLAVPGPPRVTRESAGDGAVAPARPASDEGKASARFVADRKAALGEARRLARRAAKARSQAAATVETAARRLLDMESAVTAARQRLDAAKQGVVDARAELSAAERDARATVVAAEAAERAVTLAADALDAATKDPT